MKSIFLEVGSRDICSLQLPVVCNGSSTRHWRKFTPTTGLLVSLCMLPIETFMAADLSVVLVVVAVVVVVLGSDGGGSSTSGEVLVVVVLVVATVSK